MRRQGPLSGIRVLELAGIGPGPFCGMVLSDLGADVVRIERPGPVDAAVAEREHLNRGRRSLALDLKDPRSADLVLRLVERADVLFEGFRPGVAERLGLGPAECLRRNPALVYGRMTGYGQDGPMAAAAGHDINYIAMSGALDAIGRAGERPVPPLNLVGDFGGGGMLLVVGLLAALVDARRTGAGQVVDAAMVDGSALLMAMQGSLAAQGLIEGGRGENILDGGAPYYDTYETADGGYVAVGAIEPHFYAAMVEGLGLEPSELPPREDRDRWPELRAAIAGAFLTAPRRAWEERFAGVDACVTPVLSLEEAAAHPHNRARATYVDPGNGLQPAPAPRFSSTPASIGGLPPVAGAGGESVLQEWLSGPPRSVPTAATEVPA